MFETRGAFIGLNLMRRGDLKQDQEKSLTCFDFAVMHKNREMAQHLIEAGIKNSDPPMLCSLSFKNLLRPSLIFMQSRKAQHRAHRYNFWVICGLKNAHEHCEQSQIDLHQCDIKLYKSELELGNIAQKLLNLEKQQTPKCVICRVNAKSVIYLPCFHLSCCAECDVDLEKRNRSCPICRTPVTGHVLVNNKKIKLLIITNGKIRDGQVLRR